jgi:hypothetical protein
MPNPLAAVYPARAATDLDLFVASNGAQTLLQAAIDNAVQVIPLNSAANFPAPCLIAIGAELIVCPTAAVADTFSGTTRGAFGTLAAAHAINAPASGLISSQHHNQLSAEVQAIEAALLANGPRNVDNEIPAGAINGINNTFTLAHSPSPAASVLYFRNGQLQQQGIGKDYTIAGNTITTNTTPQTGDTIQAYYRY